MNALGQAGMTTNSRLWHCDEMRFGLWGQVRRRWGLKGKKIIQRMQIVFHWSYLVLAVDVLRGELHWGWSQGMRQQHLVPILDQWPVDGVVWDVIEWVRGRWGVNYSYQGMYTLMKGHGLGLKVPRPHSAKADAKQQMAWKKGAY